MRRRKAGFDLDHAGRDQRGEARAEFATGDELIVGSAAESLGRIVSSEQPDNVGAGHLASKRRQVCQGADRGMTGAEDRDGLAGEARSVPA